MNPAHRVCRIKPIMRTMTRRLYLCALLLAAAGVAFAQEPDLGTEEQRAAGQELYDLKCAHCHGMAGDARSVATPFLRPAPRDFDSGQYKFRSTASGELPTTEDIKRSIRLGMPYTSMPAWSGILSESEIENLAYYIKTFNSDFAGPYGSPEVIPVPKAPAYDESRLARGREVFDANQCADCHGTNGRGNGPSAPDLVDDWGEPIRAADMTKRWTFRGGSSREDIYRTFTTGLNGTPMPSYQQTVEEEDRWALVDYVWSLSRQEPEYGTVVAAVGQDRPIDVTKGPELFEGAPGAYFPIVGQIIEPGRSFYPGVNGVEVKAIYNLYEIAFMLSWHDMTPETAGSNGLTMSVPMPDTTDSTAYSDAVALLLPAQNPPGLERPYFMFGDTDNPMLILFADLGQDESGAYLGMGSNSITETNRALEHYARYEDGEWTVIFKSNRVTEGGLEFAEEAFTPVSFSVWDGASRERGNKRGLSAWYHVYLTPFETESAALPMAKWAFIVLVLELGIIGLVRWRNRKRMA